MAKKSILLDETFSDKMNTLNGLVGALVKENAPTSVNWEYLEELAISGIFGNLYDIGTTFSEPWKDGNTEYTFPWMLQHLGSVELEDGETLENRPFLQLKYATPYGVQFSHPRAFLACPDGLSAGTYYFTIESSWGSNVSAGDVVCFTTTVDVPAGGRIAGCYYAPDQAKSNWRIYTYKADGKTILETLTPTFSVSGTSLGTQKYNTRNGNINSLQEMAFGWNRWKYSAIRQWLNSEKATGAWWSAQDEWDIAPDQLTSKPGFLYYYRALADDSSATEADRLNAQRFLESIKATKVITYVNTVQDGGSDDYDITYDRVFIPSLEQMYINPQHSGEGEYWERWKRQSGRTSPCAQGATYPELITYAVENHTSAQAVRLRSADRGYAFTTWFVFGSGYVGGYDASNAFRCSPVVVL